MKPSRIAGVTATAATLATLALPGVAGAAAGDKTFPQTFPLASSLCARVTAGVERKSLKPSAAQVLADCSTLQSTFTSAQSTVLAARGTIAPQVAADHAAIAAACPAPANPPSATCVQTRKIEKAALDALQSQRIAAAMTYYHAIDAARHHFWAAIRTLPGEHRVRADPPVPVQTS
jgi:hypothetical protein